MSLFATHPVIRSWLDTLNTETALEENYKHYWGKDASTLITSSFLKGYDLGSGSHIYEKAVIPAIESAEEEVLFVTCFWARSSALSQLCTALVSLSRKALARNDGSKIRVRLCLSSRSLFQKLFHRSSHSGYTYPPTAWNPLLGLPRPCELNGLDLQVKSIFFCPFSVFHSKFLVVDRQKALVPSCNVSWEDWLECCLTLQGPVVRSLTQFWEHVWVQKDFSDVSSTVDLLDDDGGDTRGYCEQGPRFTLILPSPHHSSLRLSFPLLRSPTPLTPLNSFLLCLLGKAQHSVHIFTPNLTSQPVIDALLAALARGVDVNIVTNRRMMVLEQIITAGTITEICMWRLKASYLQQLATLHRRSTPALQSSTSLEEGGLLGNLIISYYYPAGEGVRPDRIHIKCTIVDDEIIVLGSGNMDRASWFTSQELGIALFGKDVTNNYRDQLRESMCNRVEVYYQSKPASTSDHTHSSR